MDKGQIPGHLHAGISPRAFLSNTNGNNSLVPQALSAAAPGAARDAVRRSLRTSLQIALTGPEPGSRSTAAPPSSSSPPLSPGSADETGDETGEYLLPAGIRESIHYGRAAIRSFESSRAASALSLEGAASSPLRQPREKKVGMLNRI